MQNLFKSHLWLDVKSILTRDKVLVSLPGAHQLSQMTSVIPSVTIPLQPLARAPRNVRAKNLLSSGLKNKDSLTAGAGLTFPTSRM